MTSSVIQAVREAYAEAAANPRFPGRLGEITASIRALAKLCGLEGRLRQALAGTMSADKKTFDVALEAIIVQAVRDGYKDVSMLHLDAELALAGHKLSPSRLGVALTQSGLLKPAGRFEIHGKKSSYFEFTKRGIGLAGKKLGQKKARGFCQQGFKKFFTLTRCAGCPFDGVCAIQRMQMGGNDEAE